MIWNKKSRGGLKHSNILRLMSQPSLRFLSQISIAAVSDQLTPDKEEIIANQTSNNTKKNGLTIQNQHHFVYLLVAHKQLHLNSSQTCTRKQ